MGSGRDNCYAAALDADMSVSPLPCGQLLFEWGVSAMRRGELARAEEILAELDRILPRMSRDGGTGPRWRSRAGSWMSPWRSSRRWSTTSDDPEYRSTYAEILAARGEREVAACEAERAAAAYDRLLARRPEAYADHAAAFFMGIGHRPQRAVELAEANWKLRDTPRSRRSSAAQGAAQRASELHDARTRRPGSPAWCTCCRGRITWPRSRPMP